MGKARYYCEVCDVFLTHDSQTVRKSHNAGRKHKDCSRAYWEEVARELALERMQKMGIPAPGGMPGQGMGGMRPPMPVSMMSGMGGGMGLPPPMPMPMRSGRGGYGGPRPPMPMQGGAGGAGGPPGGPGWGGGPAGPPGGMGGPPGSMPPGNMSGPPGGMGGPPGGSYMSAPPAMKRPADDEGDAANKRPRV